MGRGRPKGSKNKSTIQKENVKQISKIEEPIQNSLIFLTDINDSVADNIQTLEEKTTVKTAEKPLKNNGICDCCNQPIYTTPINIPLTYLTGKASWHRNCKVDRLKLCSDCSKELNELVDNWIISKNKNLKKFENLVDSL